MTLCSTIKNNYVLETRIERTCSRLNEKCRNLECKLKLFFQFVWTFLIGGSSSLVRETNENIKHEFRCVTIVLFTTVFFPFSLVFFYSYYFPSSKSYISLAAATSKGIFSYRFLISRADVDLESCEKRDKRKKGKQENGGSRKILSGWGRMRGISGELVEKERARYLFLFEDRDSPFSHRHPHILRRLHPLSTFPLHDLVLVR